MVNAQVFLAQILNLKGQYKAASQLYDQINALDGPLGAVSARSHQWGAGAGRGQMLSRGDNDNALEIAERTYERERQRSGEKVQIPR